MQWHDENRTLMSERQLARFLLPVMASAVFQQAYALISAGIVGRVRSTEAVAVIGSCAFLSTAQHFLFNGMTTGFGIVQCRYLGQSGQKEEDGLPEGGIDFGRVSFWGGIYLTILLAAAAGVLVFAVDPILNWLNVPDTLQKEASGYAAWIIAGSGLAALRNYLIWIVQGLKRTGTAGVVIAVSVVTQTVLTLLMNGVLRLPVWASAAAVLINNGIICGVLAVCLILFEGKKLFPCSPLKVPGRVYREMLSAGFGKSTMMAMVAFAGIIRQRAVNGFSVDELSGYTYASAISNVFQVFVGAYGTAAAVLCGRWFGAGRFQELKQEYRRLMTHSVIAALSCSVLAWFCSFVMLSVLAGDVPKTVLAAGGHYLTISQWGLAGLSVYLTGRYTLQSVGNNRSQLILGAVESLSGVLMLKIVIERVGFSAMEWYPVVTWMLSGAVAVYLLRKERIHEKKLYS